MSKSKSCSIPVNVKLDLPADRSSQIVFNFKLPKDGWSLRSVRCENGKEPELEFEPSPNVPTIQEEDVAVCFRLAAEGERPEFFYILFLPNHPLSYSRWFMQYSPIWLRWTAIGKLLADADWNMKCMHVGVRTNEEKTVFQSWQSASNLDDLASRIDFPHTLGGRIILSCKDAAVAESDDEICFPEEPKMQITDETSPLYSEYITKHYDSVGYYDEPKFLKVREIIKLTLGIEWLYNKKGVRVNEDWIKMHTSKPSSTTPMLELAERKEPPSTMLPQPTEPFERPSSDVKVKTVEAEMYRTLTTEHGLERRYGYYDFGGSEVVMFKKDGTKCKTQKSMKFTFDFICSEGSQKGWMYLPLPDDADVPELLQQGAIQLRQDFPAQTRQEIALPLPASVDTKVKVSNDDSKLVLKVTHSIHPCPPLALPSRKEVRIMTATINNYDKLFANMDPNMPILPAIQGVCKAIIPGVESWEELITELSVPFPRIWQAPFFGVGEPTATGGVSTSSIPVRHVEPVKKREVDDTMEWKDNYRRNGHCLSVRARTLDIAARGRIQLVDAPDIKDSFLSSWIKGARPSRGSISIFSITNPTLLKQWKRYGQSIDSLQFERHYHGTTLACDILASQKPCQIGNCGACGIACAGMDPNCIRKDREHFQRYGNGFYFAPNASKCNDYTLANSRGYKAILACDVIPGQKHELTANQQKLTGPPPGHNSVYGEVGEALNYPELVVYNQHAVMPRFIIVYK